jgi:hemoglobin
MGRDLDRRGEIHDAVVAFYREVVFDDLLGPVFDEVAEVDWAVHIPALVDYWCRVLIGGGSVPAPIVEVHRRVHNLEPFAPDLFDRWYWLWASTVDGRWCGPAADRAKLHAARIGSALSRRLTGVGWRAAPADGVARDG